MITGLDCPLCGSQRAILCFVRGEFSKGFAYNYALIVMIPLLTAFILVEFFNKSHRFDHLKALLYHRWARYSYFSLFFLWWIVRNL